MKTRLGAWFAVLALLLVACAKAPPPPPPDPVFAVTASFVGARNYSAPEIKLAAALHPNKRIANGLTCVSRSIFPDPGLKLARLIHQNQVHVGLTGFAGGQ